MNSIEKGRLAEAKVASELVQQGMEVFVPAFGNAKCDLIALDSEGAALRIEVKYCNAHSNRGESWEVHLRQVRHNSSVTTVKKFNSENSDMLAVYLAAVDKVMLFDAEALHGRSSLAIRFDEV